MQLDYVGFNKLRSGRIHVFCPACGRKQSNMFRDNEDPITATLVHVYCDRCCQGCKDVPVRFFNSRGLRIRETWEGPA